MYCSYIPDLQLHLLQNFLQKYNRSKALMQLMQWSLRLFQYYSFLKHSVKRNNIYPPLLLSSLTQRSYSLSPQLSGRGHFYQRSEE